MSDNLIKTLQEQQIPVEPVTVTQPNVMSYFIDSTYWLKLVNYAEKTQCRFAAIWAQQLYGFQGLAQIDTRNLVLCEATRREQPEHIETYVRIANNKANAAENQISTGISDNFQLTLCLEENNNYLLFNTILPTKAAKVASCANSFPAANRMERHIRDLYGIIFTDTPDNRRWTRHKAWRDYEFPLNKNYRPKTIVTENTPPHWEYHFNTIEGPGVCEIPVGPIHAGIIEPGHFRFSVSGENILRLEERLGYVHKGIEKIAENKTIDDLLRLAGRVSGDSTIAHAWALCRASEDPHKIAVPPRAIYLRAIMAERERIANHIGDMGALCNDVGFAFAHYQMGRLRELWQRTSKTIFGHRFMMDQIVFGGVRQDITSHDSEIMLQQIAVFKTELTELYSIIDNNASLQDRFVTTGVLQPEIAKKLGVLGYVGKASGQNFDTRRDIPYAPYDQINFTIPCYLDGDVAARFNVRAQEVLISFNIIEELLKTMPKGKINLDINSCSILANHEGMGYVEGWRGEILAYVRFNAEGKTERYFPRDPSWFNWLALEKLVHGNIVPDFPVCNKSINASYAGSDL